MQDAGVISCFTSHGGRLDDHEVVGGTTTTAEEEDDEEPEEEAAALEAVRFGDGS